MSTTDTRIRLRARRLAAPAALLLVSALLTMAVTAVSTGAAVDDDDTTLVVDPNGWPIARARLDGGCPTNGPGSVTGLRFTLPRGSRCVTVTTQRRHTRTDAWVTETVEVTVGPGRTTLTLPSPLEGSSPTSIESPPTQPPPTQPPPTVPSTTVVPSTGPGASTCTHGHPLSDTTAVSGLGPPQPRAIPHDSTVLLVGHSNGAAIAPALIERSGAVSDVTIVDATWPGHDSQAWAENRPADGEPSEQEHVVEALTAAGRTPDDVDVVVVLALSRRYEPPGESVDAETAAHTQDLLDLVAWLEDLHPHLEQVHLTGGIATPLTSGRNEEPAAHRTGFAVVDALAAYDGPLHLVFGPYLWNDPTCARRDGLHLDPATMLRDDVHPNGRGASYLAAYIVDYLSTHPSTRTWFPRAG